jgi:hypothetical protein
MGIEPMTSGWKPDTLPLRQRSIKLVAQRRVELLAVGYEPTMLPLHYRAPINFQINISSITIVNRVLYGFYQLRFTDLKHYVLYAYHKLL